MLFNVSKCKIASRCANVETVENKRKTGELLQFLGFSFWRGRRDLNPSKKRIYALRHKGHLFFVCNFVSKEIIDSRIGCGLFTVEYIRICFSVCAFARPPTTLHCIAIIYAQRFHNRSVSMPKAVYCGICNACFCASTMDMFSDGIGVHCKQAPVFAAG